jgi:excisionase family DNA binding protein
MHPHQYNLTKATYSVAETMAHLSVGRTKLYELIKTKKLKPLKIGKKTIFPAAELAGFLSSLAA